MTTVRFDATVNKLGPGANVIVPPDALEALGGGGRIPVTATFDGVEYKGSVVRMGGEMLIGITKAVQAAMGKGPGDTIAVTLTRDVGERVVEVPDDLRAALRAAGVEAAFDTLAYSHRKEHVRAIEEAKKPETRARRIAKAVEMLGG